MKIAIVGATGLVGTVMLEVLKEFKIPVTELIPVASARSVGGQIEWNGRPYSICSVDEAIAKKPHIALFSAGSTTSIACAHLFAEADCFVIDNSSAFRMEPGIPLVIPEVNAHVLSKDTKIIANPNCSTMQMVVALNPLHQLYNIKRLVISTYQSFTGTGMKAVKQYEDEKKGLQPTERAYHHPIFENCIPHCDVFLENGYTKEEMKLVHETRKILNAPDMQITSTAVRIPVYGGHSESVNVEFERAYELSDVRSILAKSPGITVQDDNAQFNYPTPQQARNKNEVFVGRIRRDESRANALNLWIVSDNLRKGAATNAVQIAKYLIESGLIIA